GAPVNTASASFPSYVILNRDLPLVTASDTAGAFYLAGTQVSTNNPAQMEVFLSKLSPEGLPVWRKAFGTQGSSLTASSLGLDCEGNIYLAGLLLPLDAAAPCFVAKYDPSGNRVWLKTFGTAIGDIAFGLFTDPAGLTTIVANGGRIFQF